MGRSSTADHVVKAAASPPPHVLVFPFPAQGHVNGAMDISRKLASMGVSITFVCTEAYISSMVKQGFNTGGLPIRLLGLADGLPPEKSMTDTLDQVDVLVRVTESMGPALEDLLNKLSQEQPLACVIYDFMLWWVGNLARSDLFHIPAYIFYPMSASFYSYLIHIPEFVSQGRLPLGHDHTDLTDESNVFKIAGFPPMHVTQVPDISWKPNPVCSFDYVLRCATHWRDASGILLNTVYELEKEVIESLKERAPEMDIRAVGPVLPSYFLSGEDHHEDNGASSESADAQRCLEWLDKQPPSSVLYIAFGTIACLSEAQLQEVATVLEASKEQRFVWVVRIPEQQLQQAQQNSENKAGWKMGLEGFEERTKGRGVVLWELAPQRKILAKKAVGAFLTHCGWNSTLEALSKGVPMLCCPMFADQGMNGKWVVEVLETGGVLKGSSGGGQLLLKEAEEAAVIVQDVMSGGANSSIRLAASRIGAVARYAALHPAGSSHVNLHAFVQTLFTHQE